MAENHSMRWIRNTIYKDPDVVVYRGYLVRYDEPNIFGDTFFPVDSTNNVTVPVFAGPEVWDNPAYFLGYAKLRNLKNGLHAVIWMYKDLLRRQFLIPKDTPVDSDSMVPISFVPHAIGIRPKKFPDIKEYRVPSVYTVPLMGRMYKKNYFERRKENGRETPNQVSLAED